MNKDVNPTPEATEPSTSRGTSGLYWWANTFWVGTHRCLPHTYTIIWELLLKTFLKSSCIWLYLLRGKKGIQFVYVFLWLL
jgi:hypothetical protein